MIYELEKVDMMTVEKDNPTELCLGIADEVQWDHHVEEHLLLLQEKMNNYVTFILSKGYLSATKDKEYGSFAINIYFANTPDDMAISFLQTYQNQLLGDNLPIRITCEVVEPDYNKSDDSK